MAEHDGGAVPPNTGSPTGTTPQTDGTATGEGGTPPTSPPETPPTTPDPDPLTVDIKDAIQRARKEEKDKLYSRITQTETEVKAAREALEQAQEQNRKLTESLSKLTQGDGDKEGDKGGKGGESSVSADDIQRAIDAAARTTLERAEKEIFGPKLAALEEANKALQTQLKAKDLDAYKNSLIEANKEAIIPELVIGETKEELDNALVVAKQAFAKVAQTLTSRKEDVATHSANQIPPLPSLAKGNSPTDAPASVGQLTDEEYAEKRAALLREASEQVRGALAEQPTE